jgi:predicted Zn-dependent peptidase
MKTINIRSSDLAKLTGHNNYESKENIIKTILNDNGIKKCYVPKSNIEDGLSKMTKEDLKEVKKELKLPDNVALSVVETQIKRTVMKDSYSSDIKEESSKQNVDKNLVGKVKLQALELSIKKDLQMRRGNIKEDKNLDFIQKKNNITIVKRNSQLYVKELYRDPDEKYNIVLKGMVDGLTGEKIVETKNRTKRLFHELRQYERVQLEAYIFLTGIKDAVLTEHYNEESNEIEYSHDDCFWEKCLEKVVEFMEMNIIIHL